VCGGEWNAAASTVGLTLTFVAFTSIRFAEALMDMMLNRDGQGPYRDYRADSHPLQQQLSAAAAADESQRRPVPSSPPLPVVVEDAEARHRTEQHLFDAFGSSPMPALDQVNFRV
jgi:hypothetical protein